MAELRATKGALELVWTDGVWSGTPQAVNLAMAESESGDTVEILPFGTFPADDDSREVVGWIMTWVLGGLDRSPGYAHFEGGEDMRQVSAVLDADYDASGIVY